MKTSPDEGAHTGRLIYGSSHSGSAAFKSVHFKVCLGLIRNEAVGIMALTLAGIYSLIFTLVLWSGADKLPESFLTHLIWSSVFLIWDVLLWQQLYEVFCGPGGSFPNWKNNPDDDVCWAWGFKCFTESLCYKLEMWSLKEVDMEGLTEDTIGLHYWNCCVVHPAVWMFCIFNC